MFYYQASQIAKTCLNDCLIAQQTLREGAKEAADVLNAQPSVKRIFDICDKRVFIFVSPEDNYHLFAKVRNEYREQNGERVLDNCIIQRVAYYDVHEAAWIADFNAGEQNCNPYAFGRVPPV